MNDKDRLKEADKSYNNQLRDRIERNAPIGGIIYIRSGEYRGNRAVVTKHLESDAKNQFVRIEVEIIVNGKKSVKKELFSLEWCNSEEWQKQKEIS
ncbi:MAG: hypothetical protein WCW87_02815 [Candidatus Paceibacterota bacterium]